MIARLNKRIGMISDDINDQVDQFEKTLNGFDFKLKSIVEDGKELRMDQSEKLDKTDGKKIWDQF